MRKIKGLTAIVIILYSITLFSCGNKSETKPNEEKKFSMVKVTEIKQELFTDEFKVVGVVKPFTTAKLSSEEGGLILSIYKDKGGYVSKGQIVARLKKDVDIANYEQLEAQYELARINYEKQKQLWEENATTELQYLTAKWQMEATGRSLNVLRTRLRSEYIRSPISGIVEEKFMNKGEMSAPGVPILSIVDVSSVKISAGVPEKYLTQIKTGQKVKITVDVLPGVEFTGKINYISPSLSTLNRTFEIEIIISNKDRLLKPEMNANVIITKKEINEAVVITQDLIIDYGDEKFVYVLDANSIARKRKIKTDGRNGNAVLIIEGLKPGEKLITEGYQSLTDGDTVQVVN